MADSRGSGRPKRHDWHIEAREYARQEARRGRRFAYTAIDPERTALIVIDMVPFFVRENPYCLGIVPVISRLADGLRDAGGTVAWVLPAPYQRSAVEVEFFGPQVTQLHRMSGEGGLWQEFTVHDGDLVVAKSAASAFFPGRCELPDRLTDRGIDTVLITGTVTNVCCESSARDASTLGFRVIMIADGNAGRRDQDHNATLYTIYRTFGDVRPAADVLAMMAVP